VRESAFVSDHSTARNVVIAAIIIFFAAHFVLVAGVTTPEKFYFDEVHYVPAARQMLESVTPTPILNPMHPPLAKQLMALSIRSLGDAPLGWRYPSVLFGALAVVAIYLCGLALFAAQAPAIALAGAVFPDGGSTFPAVSFGVQTLMNAAASVLGGAGWFAGGYSCWPIWPAASRLRSDRSASSAFIRTQVENSMGQRTLFGTQAND